MERIASRTMKLSGLFCSAMLLSLSPALAATSYLVTLNTTLISGQNGFVDLQLNPLGAGSQAVTATITGFTTNGMLTGVPGGSGPVTGALPGTVTMPSAPTPSLDYFHGITFGTSISFVVTLSGPALDTPTGMAPGTTFLVSLYDAANTNPLLSGVANGGIVAIDVTSAGTTAVTLYPRTNDNDPTVGAATLVTMPVITTQPVNQTVCAGATATFTATASGTPTPTVQWQFSTDGGATFNSLAGAISTTLSIPATTAAQNNNQFHAVFTNAAGSIISAAATLIVNTTPTVTTNPLSQTVTAGNPVTFTASASGQPTPTVQWERSTDGGATFAPIAGATALSLTFSTAAGDNGNQYRAVFTNTCGKVTTSAAVLTVNTPPQITLQPSNQTVCAGATATFMAAASGRPTPTVQWQVSVANGPFTNIPGATNTTLNVTGTTAAMNGNRYQAVFSNGVGTVTTNIVLLTVNTAPVITLNPVDQTVNEGQLVTFTAAATGQPTPTVQWEVSVNGGPFVAIPGATSTTFTFTAAQALTKNRYRAVFTNTCGIATTDPAIFINIPFDVFQIRYASNLTQGDSVINISNTGVNGASLTGPGFGGAQGNICVNAYAFSPDEQLISCCSCLLTPNALASLSVNGDMISNTLTGVRPNSVVIKLVATGAGADFTGTSCTNSAALVNTTGFPFAPGMVAYGTTIHPPAVTETPFLRGTLSLQELASIKNRCTNIIGNGSTFGICRSCRVGGLNGAQ